MSSCQKGIVHPPRVKPPSRSSSGPPGACMTPSRETNSETRSLRIRTVQVVGVVECFPPGYRTGGPPFDIPPLTAQQHQEEEDRHADRPADHDHHRMDP